ncbi:MAG: glycosyltransferase [Bacteroidota bacterium]
MTERRIHVAFMVGSLRMGGAERMMIHTANQLAKYVQVSFLSLTGGAELKPELQKNVRLISFEKKKTLAAIPAILKFLKTEKPDVLISTQIHVNLVAMLLKIVFRTKTKIILREATSPGAQFMNFQDVRSRTVKWMVKMLYPKADAIVAICEAVKNNLVEHHFAKMEQVTVIFNPVINQHLIEGMKVETDDEFFHAGVPVIISSGRLAPVKNFSLLIESFHKLLQKQDARLIIMGEGQERSKLESLISQVHLDRKVKLIGMKQNPFPYLKKSSVYVLTSLFEGLPNALIEAMACGLQLISVDCPGGSGEVLMNGELGKLVPMNNVDALADAMSAAIQNPLPKNLLLEGVKRFDAEKVSVEYLKLVERLVSK